MTPDFGCEVDDTGEQFVWDTDKDTRNREKHGVSFLDAMGVFVDPHAFELDDVKHSREGEKRVIRVGKMKNGEIITVVYTLSKGIRRLITAHRNRGLKRRYEKGQIKN